MQYCALLIVLALCLLGHHTTVAQNTNVPQYCNETNSMDFNPSQLAGSWYEVARNPAPTGSFICVQVNFTALPNNGLNIATTYSNTPDYPWVNQTMLANITVDSSNTNGYNISYENGRTNTTATVFKLLATDYSNYAFVCGYQNASDVSTFFGIVLTRQQLPNTTVLNGYESLASASYADFQNGTMALIMQSQTCYLNGAVSAVPFLYAVVAAIYTALHLVI